MTKEYHCDIYVDPEAAKRMDSRVVDPSLTNREHIILLSRGYRESPKKVSLLDMDIVSDQ